MTEARELAAALGGRWHGTYGTAPCPVCQPDKRKEQTALTLADGRAGLLLHCKRGGCAFADILAAAGIRPGTFTPPDGATNAQREAERRAEAVKRARQADSLWNEAQPITGTPAERYLRGRDITCALPPSLRFHPEAWHAASARRLPAMVVRVQAGAVHRTFLRPNGQGKAEAEPAKAMLGACAGGAVALSTGPGPLVVAEGVETGLSLLSGLLAWPAVVWAALSTSGIRGLRLPRQAGRLIIAADGDEPGRAAALSLAERAGREGWSVGVMHAPEGCDFNDVLTGDKA